MYIYIYVHVCIHIHIPSANTGSIYVFADAPPLLYYWKVHAGFISIALSVKVVEGVVIQVGGQ